MGSYSNLILGNTKRTVALAALLLGYAGFALYFFGNWEFTGDDANTLNLAAKAFQQPFWFGAHSSQGILHTPFIYYFYGLFYTPIHDYQSVQIGILLFILAGHVVLVQIGKELGSRKLGFLASILFFFSPAFFVYFNQKFWEMTLLPTFSSAALLCLLRYQRSGKWKYALGAVISVVLCISCQLGCVVLIPPLLIGFDLAYQKNPGRRFTVGQKLLLGSIFLLGLSTILLWVFQKHVTEGMIVVIPFAIALPLTQRIKNRERFYFYITFCFLPIFAALLTCRLPIGDFGRATQGILDLLSAFSPYVPTHIGIIGTQFPRLLIFVPEAFLVLVFFFVAIVKYSRLSESKKLLLYWVFLPLYFVILTETTLFFFPHQWGVILFPGLWLVVLIPLLTFIEDRPLLGNRSIAVSLLIALLILAHSALSIREALYVQNTGGSGMHLASLKTKVDVLQWIAKKATDPILVEETDLRMEWGDFDIEGWKYLWRSRGSPVVQHLPTSERRIFYLLQNNGPNWNEELKSRLEKIPGIVRKRIGSVTIYEGDPSLLGPGVRLVD